MRIGLNNTLFLFASDSTLQRVLHGTLQKVSETGLAVPDQNELDGGVQLGLKSSSCVWKSQGQGVYPPGVSLGSWDTGAAK